jgi:hypothetical protein
MLFDLTLHLLDLYGELETSVCAHRDHATSVALDEIAGRSPKASDLRAMCTHADAITIQLEKISLLRQAIGATPLTQPETRPS